MTQQAPQQDTATSVSNSGGGASRPNPDESKGSDDSSIAPSTSSTSANPHPALRCLTIDVEEYYHIEAAYGSIPRSDWGNWPARVERNIDLLLEIMDRHNCRGTFFILGDVARRTPQVVRKIHQAGHEIASHGTDHDRLHRLDPERFRQDINTSRSLLQDLTGQPIFGYRAPTFSVVPQTAWAIDVLIEAGFTYDASIFPVTHPAYGVPSAPVRPFWVQSQPQGPTLLEVPPLTWTPQLGPFKKNLAVAGGGYFRLLPLWFMLRGLDRAARQHRPAVLYFHPWEFDPGTPAMPLPAVGRLRTYTGLRKAAQKLERVLKAPARWAAIADVLDLMRADADRQPKFLLGPAATTPLHN